MNRYLYLLLTIPLLLLIPQTVATANTYLVPIDYPTIQDAVNNVPPGSTIRILGTVVENGIVIDKTLTIEGGVVDYGDDWGFYVRRGTTTFRDITLKARYLWYNGIISPTFTYSSSVGIIAMDSEVVIDNVTIYTDGRIEDRSEKISYYYGIVGRDRSIVRGDGLNISGMDIGIEMSDTQRSITPQCYLISTSYTKCLIGGVDKMVTLDISNATIQSEIGVAIFSTYPNDYYRVRDFNITSEIPIYIRNIFKDSSKTDYSTYTFSGGELRSSPDRGKFNQPYGTGVYIISMGMTDFTLSQALVYGERYGVQHQEAGGEVKYTRWRIAVERSSILAYTNGFRYDSAQPKATVSNDVDVFIRDTLINSYSNTTSEGILITSLNPLRNYLHVEVINTNISGYDIGISFQFNVINTFNFTMHRLFFLNPSGYGLSVQTVSFEKGYLWAGYSLLYSIIVITETDYPFYLYETVYDEKNSLIWGKIEIEVWWTLLTEVFSSLTNNPIQGATVTYNWDIGTASGLTDSAGRYTYQFHYRYGVGPRYGPSYTFVNTIWVGANYYGVSGSTTHQLYFGDTLTSPSWFRHIDFYLPALILKVLGFSHDMGTTYLVIRGLEGAFIGYYSYTPDEIKVPPSIQDMSTGFRRYPLRVTSIVFQGVYTRVDAQIFYDGYWQPTTIYIGRVTGMVWSPGPVDFRGWLG